MSASGMTTNTNSTCFQVDRRNSQAAVMLTMVSTMVEWIPLHSGATRKTIFGK